MKIHFIYVCTTYCNPIRALNLSILISDTFLFKVDQNACNRAMDLYVIFSRSIGLTHIRTLKLAFPMGRDSATFRDKGTEIPSLSRDKGTTGQAQNLATGRDGILTACPVPSRDVPRDKQLSIFHINGRKKNFNAFSFISVPRDVPGQDGTDGQNPVPFRPVARF